MIPFSIINIWMAIEGRRRLVQVLPDTVREWWDHWELQGLVFISLAAQILLTLLGNRRKYGTNKVTELIVWSAYYLADKVPTFAIGVISGKLGDYYEKHDEPMEDPQLIAFWAPFFLMHAGGPDTITAYSLEDNELWLRHLVGLLVQTLVSVYIILLSWKSTSWLSWLSIPMLITGFVKYSERTWCLYSASINYCRDSHLSSIVSEREGVPLVEWLTGLGYVKGFKVFFASVFSDIMFETKDIEEFKEYFHSAPYNVAFRRIDLGHGCSYDILYTKASVTHTIWGCISRLVTLITVLVVFICYVNIFNTQYGKYSGLDPIITCMLLVAAVISEIFSIILLVTSSDVTIIFLSYINDKYRIRFISVILKWLEQRNSKKKRRWNSLGQCNFLTLYLEHKFFGDSLSPTKLEKFSSISSCPVSLDLKKMLFENAKAKTMDPAPIRYRPIPVYKELVKAHRLRSRQRLIIENLEFHQSIILWHIVTNVCYYCDVNRDVNENDVQSRESKKLSDYMFYLLLKRRHMLPVGTGLLTLRDTYSEAVKYCQKQQTLTLSSNESEAWKTLFQHITDDTEYAATRPKGRSVFRYGFVTAHDLLSRQSRMERWKFLIDLWIEILNYGAGHCRVDRHAQEVGNGGEFITHVWGLQACAALLQQVQCQQTEDDEGVVAGQSIYDSSCLCFR